jgi:4-amino-4-deoxy-L-arabinose transferase-like glycosyltransferase
VAALKARAPSPSRELVALALIALLIRLAIAARPLVVLDRMFAPDDTYYTLAIARSLAHGLGPTVDGLRSTSGFQPLLAFLVAPVFRFTDDPDVAFRAVLGIGAFADALSTWLVGHLTFRIGRGSRVGAIIASTLWAISTAAIAASMNGLESSLAVACTLGALAMWLAAQARGTVVAWLLSGVLLGLCLFARVDTVFFVAAVGLATLLRAGARATLLSAAAALAAVGPWWLHALTRFGTIVPQSGAAVREQALIYQALGMNVRDQLAWAAGAVVGPPLVDSTWLRQALGSGASAIGCAITVAIVVAAVAIARRGRSHDALRILCAHAACLLLFYGLYLPATWFFRRYLLPIHAVAAIAVALGLARVWAQRLAHPRRFRAVTLVVLGCMTATLVALVRFVTFAPTMTVDQGHHGAKGYREPARQILARAPQGAVVGALQSGALGWFAHGSERRVVNLDGVVDVEAAEALRGGHLAAFARSRGVTHLADWDVNVRLFLARSGDPRLTRASLVRVAEAEAQGPHERFVLYEIRWPNAE